jgi:hypothetical protein
VDLCLKWTMFEKAKKRQEVGTVTKRTPKTKSFRCMRNRPNHGMHRYSEKKESTKLKSKNRNRKPLNGSNLQRRLNRLSWDPEESSSPSLHLTHDELRHRNGSATGIAERPLEGEALERTTFSSLFTKVSTVGL